MGLTRSTGQDILWPKPAMETAMQTLGNALRAALYGSAFIGLFAWTAIRVRAFDSATGQWVPDWARMPAAIIGSAGVLVALICVSWFVFKGRGTPAPFDPPREFVAGGPYRYVRNPMYIGGLTALAAAGVALRSGGIFLLALGLFGCLHAFIVFVEEPGLRKRFGEPYGAYCKAVNRWIPRWRRWR